KQLKSKGRGGYEERSDCSGRFSSHRADFGKLVHQSKKPNGHQEGGRERRVVAGGRGAAAEGRPDSQPGGDRKGNGRAGADCLWCYSEGTFRTVECPHPGGEDCRKRATG